MFHVDFPAKEQNTVSTPPEVIEQGPYPLGKSSKGDLQISHGIFRILLNLCGAEKPLIYFDQFLVLSHQNFILDG